jgi:hypothetical protein
MGPANYARHARFVSDPAPVVELLAPGRASAFSTSAAETGR